MDAQLDALIRERLAEELARTEPSREAIPVPLIPTDRYCSQTMFDLEQAHLFSSTWLFVGHVSEWPHAGSYRTFTRSRAPIVVVPRRVRNGQAADMSIPFVELRD